MAFLRVSTFQMHIVIDVPARSTPRLHDSMRRQLEYKLSSYSDLITHVHATLVYNDVSPGLVSNKPGVQPGQSKPWFSCELVAKLKNGEQLQAHTKGQQPNICIADAASRLARTTAREFKFAKARWSQQSAG